MLWLLFAILSMLYPICESKDLSSVSHSFLNEAIIRKIVSSVLEEEGMDYSSLMKYVGDLKTEIEGQNVKINDMESIIARQADDINNLKDSLKEMEGENEGNYVIQPYNNLTNTEKVDKAKHNPDSYHTNMKQRENKLFINQRIRTHSGQSVAFTAYLDHQIKELNPGTTIKCNQIISNYGNGYNKFTGIFTAPISGTYFTTFTIQAGVKKTNVRLLKDGQNVVGAVVHADPYSDSYRQTMASNSAVINLTAGQSLWLETIYDHDAELFSLEGYRYVTFTGFLLF
ncbi:heavy metal-binding protein HIP-like [Mercenaria mercenaria]|uniref:heavy metal-binding protein HIP-like n=1 Tax=Mercenaria mercenaria TaxID=6596 RepID=UPI00234E686A|nr:heavy metal-binding protein HIP-like [Mercenaria mercenaria]